ncbi:hypothetical protein CVT25_003939 [Psilocybe cyanescens]|uniref:Uncharacterized protein n=1 Tax=Psilocybe cyanescens TaxID=93625 RepID=A0A409WXY0_PSICY|nr:hypothetical protein CVT25_003939 [Psilocybe cyanescens]
MMAEVVRLRNPADQDIRPLPTEQADIGRHSDILSHFFHNMRGHNGIGNANSRR